MSESIFMDLENQTKKTAFIDVKNTSDKDVNFATALRDSIAAKGYTVVDRPQGAAYVLQVNVLYVGQANPSALREAVHRGYGSAWSGAVIGGAIGYSAHRNWSDAFLGGAVGSAAAGMAEVVSGAVVKDVTYTVMTDIQLKENSSREATKHHVRVASAANKVNLKWEEAEPLLVANLGKSLAGMF